MEERSAQVRSAPAAQPRASARPASATLYLLSGSGCSKARALEKTMCCTGGHLGIHMLTTTSASPPTTMLTSMHISFPPHQLLGGTHKYTSTSFSCTSLLPSSSTKCTFSYFLNCGCSECETILMYSKTQPWVHLPLWFILNFKVGHIIILSLSPRICRTLRLTKVDRRFYLPVFIFVRSTGTSGGVKI